MRALMSGKGAAYFKPVQKVKEDGQAILNEVQAKEVSKFIGIDSSQMPSWQWFLDEIKKIRLPIGWSRRLQKDRVVYENESERTYRHPNIYLFREYFYECLDEGKKVYMFKDKQRKLLNYVEERLVRQSIGLTSKRRDADKVNLQRDQDGRMVLSKLGRVNPDVKPLVGARSYMLRMLVEKIYTKKQISGKGKRAQAYAALLAKTNNPHKDNMSQQQLEVWQRVFQQAAQFYKSKYGDILSIPKAIQQCKQWQRGNPQKVIRNIVLLNINKTKIQLYWLARLMDCLPLPPNWSRKPSSLYDSYSFDPQNIRSQLHPSYLYIIMQMNRFGGIFPSLRNKDYYLSMREMTFIDTFDREYKGDIYGLLEREEKQQITDWLVLQGLNKTNLSECDYPKLMQIQAYWNALDFKEAGFAPSVSPYGQIIWSSTISLNSVKQCPYFKALLNVVKQSNLPQILPQHLKPQKTLEVWDQCRKQTQHFIQDWINGINHQVSQTIQIEDYFKQVFISPFELGVQSDSLWMQKYRAEQMYVEYKNQLSFKTQSYADAKTKFISYALSLTQIQQPYLMDQINAKIREITNEKQLLKFIQQFNDVDARDERKKQWALQNDVQQEDIFGSDISQVTLSEQQQNENQQQEEESEAQESEQEQVIQSEHHQQIQALSQEESVSSQKDKHNQEVAFLPIILAARQECIFLKQFKRKQFKVNPKLLFLSQQQLKTQLQKTYKLKQKTNRFAINYKKNINYAANIMKQLTSKKYSKQIHLMQAYAIASKLESALKEPSYLINFPLININKSICSQTNYQQILEHQQDFSVLSISDTTEVEQLIEQFLIQKKRKLLQDTYIKHNPQTIEERQTQQSLILQPIYSSKIDITKDPVLKHVSMFNNVKEFKGVFNKIDSQATIVIKKSKSVAQIKHNTVQKKEWRSTVKTPSLKNQEYFSQSGQFSRVCLSHTLQHFLPQQALKRKGDVITLEARKSLLSKGRGLQTLLSNKY